MTDMLPEPITLPQAIHYATEIVEELGPEFVYEADQRNSAGVDCWYVINNEASCLVARILHRHGVPIAVLLQWEHLNAMDMGPGGVLPTSTRTAPTRHLFARDAIDFVHDLQIRQDDQQPYGTCLTTALNRARARGTLAA